MQPGSAPKLDCTNRVYVLPNKSAVPYMDREFKTAVLKTNETLARECPQIKKE